MKRELTFQLLQSILPNPPWREDRLRETLADLRVLAEHKYNKYEMYQPARLFFESLYLFLLHFDSPDRTAALEFVRKDLTFISRDEFQQLAHVLYHDRIRQEQLNLAAQRTGVARFRVVQLANSEQFRIIKRASLYVGMSDGARMDYFRRQNLDINNEQVLAAYYAGDVKVGGVRRDLRNALGEAVDKFECLFLLDDFFGSGRTHLREVVNVTVAEQADGIELPKALVGKLSFDEDKSELQWNYSGPIQGRQLDLLKALAEQYQITAAVGQIVQRCANRETTIKGSLDRLSAEKILTIVRDDASVYLAPLLATQYAIDRMIPLIPRLKPPLNTLKIIPAAIIPNSMRMLPGSGEIPALCEKYYDPEIGDEHTGDVMYGYDSCALPLVLHHNTPNNSFYFLWARKWGDALFARYERHGRDPRI